MYVTLYVIVNCRSALTHPLGCSVLAVCLRRLGIAYAGVEAEDRAEIEKSSSDVWKAVAEVADGLASPIEPVAMEFRREMGDCPEQKRMVAKVTAR